MSAPTPASAFLHSATMVKAGIYLMARLYPALGGTELWFWLLSSTGLLTMLTGADYWPAPKRSQRPARLLHHQPARRIDDADRPEHQRGV